MRLYIFLFLALAGSLGATQLFTNPGFEMGSLNGWTVESTPSSGVGSPSSDDSFFVSSSMLTPSTGNPTVGPADGTYYAVSDTDNLVSPETTVIYQTVTIPNTDSLILSLDMFVNDVYGGLYGSSGFGGEVAIWASGSDPLTATPTTVLFGGPVDTFLDPQGDPNPYIFYSASILGDVTLGSTYEIGVLESDTSGPINVGIDDFSLMTPEPGTLLLTGAFAAGLLCFGRARRSRR